MPLNQKALSKGHDNWETPDYVFDYFDSEFGFTVDPCATAETTKCPTYYTEQQDGLAQSWKGETVFINPPYSQLTKWLDKAIVESQQPDTCCVMLVPARTDTRWFKRAYGEATSVRFISGRIKFLKEGKAQKSPPFPSMLLVFCNSSKPAWKGAVPGINCPKYPFVSIENREAMEATTKAKEVRRTWEDITPGRIQTLLDNQVQFGLANNNQRYTRTHGDGLEVMNGAVRDAMVRVELGRASKDGE